MQIEIEKILVDIIKKQMNLPENWGRTAKGDVIPCVSIYAQNIKLFNTDRIQITVKTVSSHDYANRLTYIQTEAGVNQAQYLNQQRLMQVDVYSRNNEARQRFHEVIFALKSTYAQQMQDKYAFKLASISNGQNLSGLDGGSEINRFTITFNAIVHYEKITPVDFYNDFTTTMDNEKEQFGEFTIKEEET